MQHGAHGMVGIAAKDLISAIQMLTQCEEDFAQIKYLGTSLITVCAKERQLNQNLVSWIAI